MPKAVPLLAVQVMTPVATTIEQSPDMVNPPKDVPAKLYSIWFGVPPGLPAPPVQAMLKTPLENVVVQPVVKLILK